MKIVRENVQQAPSEPEPSVPSNTLPTVAVRRGNYSSTSAPKPAFAVNISEEERAHHERLLDQTWSAAQRDRKYHSTTQLETKKQ
jgi:hypothetical protein